MKKNKLKILQEIGVIAMILVIGLYASHSANAIFNSGADGGLPDGGGGGYFQSSYYAQGAYNPVITQCNDGIDNDGNGPVDYPQDLGCTSASDTTEAGYVTTVCSDTVDNDGDGDTDLADTGCSSSADTTESPNPTCSNGVDDDLNGVTDYPSDQGCTSVTDATESGYTPPVVPGSGVVEFDGYPNSLVARDAYTHGGISPIGNFDSVRHQTGAAVSAQGQRACYLVDPTGFPSAWASGGYHSCGDNNHIIWTGSIWQKVGACGANHYKDLTCKTLAVPDTTLTASVSTTTVGGAVTLTWSSTYGRIRQGAFTGTNFALTKFVPAHCETTQNLICEPGCDATAGTRCVTAMADKVQTSQLALPVGGGCYYDTTEQCYPDTTISYPYGSSNVVNPTQTTTYRYTGTNGNGSSFSEVTVGVAGTTECTDLVSNADNDALVDAADPGCSITPPTSCVGCTPNEHTDMPDLIASNVTQTPTTPLNGSASTLSATITNIGGVTTGIGFTNLFQIDNDSNHAAVYATVTGTSPLIAKGGTNVTQASYTFPSAGTWYIRACADNNASFVGTVTESNENNNCDQGLTNWHTVTVNSSVPVATLTASPNSVPKNDSSNLTWSCSNSTSASISPSIGSVSPISGGTVSTGALANTTSFTLTCTGTGGASPGFATVTITIPTVNITANGVASSLLVKSGSSVTIAWSASADATSCAISGPGLSSTVKTSSKVVTITSLSTYTINCNGATKSVTVGLVPTFEEI